MSEIELNIRKYDESQESEIPWHPSACVYLGPKPETQSIEAPWDKPFHMQSKGRPSKSKRNMQKYLEAKAARRDVPLEGTLIFESKNPFPELSNRMFDRVEVGRIKFKE